jgi:hypothetical protein
MSNPLVRASSLPPVRLLVVDDHDERLNAWI